MVEAWIRSVFKQEARQEKVVIRAWHIRMADVFLDNIEADAAMQRCDAALELFPLDWRAASIKAKILLGQYKAKECRDIISKVRLVEDSGKDSPYSNEVGLSEKFLLADKVTPLSTLCQCELDLDRSTQGEASLVFAEILELGVPEGRAITAVSKAFGLIVERLHACGRFDDVIHLLGRVDKAETASGKALRLLLIHQDEALHAFVFDALKRTGGSSVMDGMYAAALQSEDAPSGAPPKRPTDALFIRGKIPRYLGSPVALRWTRYLAGAIGPHALTYPRYRGEQRHDPRVLLARLQHLNKQHGLASASVSAILHSIAQDYGSLGTYRDRIEFGTVLATVYTLLDEDDNALAAWNTVSPRKTGDDYGNEWITGKKSFACGCGCGESRSFGADMYICKDCVYVQLMPECFQRLKQGLLSVDVCSKDHDHLHLPEWDEAVWLKTSLHDRIVFAGNVVSTPAWSQQQAERWGLEVKAERCHVFDR